VSIRAPAERVWRVLIDPELGPDWEAGQVAVERATAPLDEPDAFCIQVMNFRGRRIAGECRVTEAFAPHTRVVRIHPPLTKTALRRERLVEIEAGTQLTLELDYETRGGPIGALLNVALTRPRLAMVLGESLRNVKRLAEAGL
jgi:uncharacterized protein YndB with AHSA1/START domain